MYIYIDNISLFPPEVKENACHFILPHGSIVVTEAGMMERGRKAIRHGKMHKSRLGALRGGFANGAKSVDQLVEGEDGGCINFRAGE